MKGKPNIIPKFDVFLSHSSVDKPWVIRLKDDLLRYGVSVWLDKDEIRPGDLFGEALELALDNCRAIALIVSPAAINSGWVKEEYYRALSLAKNKGAAVQVIPVILREADLPGFLQSRNWVDFRDETTYAQSVWKLVWGITGKKPAQILDLKALDLPSVDPVQTSSGLLGKSQKVELKNLLSNPAWGGIAGVVAILALCWSIYTFIIQPPNPTPTPTVGITLSVTATSTRESTALPPPTVTDTPILSTLPISTPTVPPPPLPTATSVMPTGSLAIPVVFNFGTKVYLTGLNGIGVNGPNEVSIEDARQPMFSYDGKFVIVKATVDGVSGLYKLSASGFTSEAINNRGSAEWPVLSLDGKTVMFSESSLDYRLQKYDDGGIEEISLNGLSIAAKNLLWTEDNQLVFQGCATWLNELDTCGVWVTNVNNLDPRRIIENENAYPMSARGGSLAYMSQEDGDWEVYVMPLKGGSAVNLTNNNKIEDGLPVISPDGNAIAYISNESRSWGVWIMNMEGQNKKRMFDIDPGRGTIDTNQWNKERMSWRR